MRKRLICLFLGVLIAAASCVCARAADLELSAPSAILMEKTTGEILYEQNSHEKLAPASVTKIMTLLLIMEQGKGTRYEHLRPTMVALVAEQIEPLLADEENALLLAQIMADNLVGGIIQILKNRVRPREVRVCMNRLLDYHTKGIHALRVE